MGEDERPGLEGLIARYRQDRAAEDPHIAALFARIDDQRFEKRLTAYVEKHTGVRMAKLEPPPAGARLMAKPRPVAGLDPDDRLRPNARRILAVRIDEVYGYDGLVADPANVRELHDMRIACKRLRYLLEIFGVAFGGELKRFSDEVASLQDILGDIHDCDVQIPMLEEHLAWLSEREAGAAQRLVAEAAARPGRRARRPSEAAFRAFQKELEVGPPRRRAHRRPRADRPPPPRARRALRALHRRVAAAEDRAVPAAAGERAGHRWRCLSGSPCSGTSTPTPPPCGRCSTRSTTAGMTRRHLHRRPGDARRRPRGLRHRASARSGWPCVMGNTDRKVALRPRRDPDHPKADARRLARLEQQPAERPEHRVPGRPAPGGAGEAARGRRSC